MKLEQQLPLNDNPTSASPARRPFARYATHAIRTLMGLAFIVFGLNGFLNFMPPPPNLPEGVASLMGAFTKSGYMMQMIASTQIIAGILLLINLFVPLGLALLAPVLVNIFLFHLFLSPEGLGFGIAFCAMELYLAWSYRRAFLPMLAPRVVPNT